MILKEKHAYVGADERGFYGHKQEQDVAFQLRRAFGDSDQIRIIHDLVIEHDGERAQIDHLVIHPYGFIIIESKSVVGEVRVNDEGEWSRSYKDSWSGMPSPIRQAELQQALLKTLLGDNVDKLLGKLLGIQAKVRGREWRVLCAVSSTAILHRDRMPKEVADRVVKTEFVAQKVQELIGSLKVGFLKGRPRFSAKELDNLGRFLLEHTARLKDATAQDAGAQARDAKAAAPVSEPAPQRYTVAREPNVVEQPTTADARIDDSQLTCKQCGAASSLTGLYGQYGYYVKCGSCNTNTSMKRPCPACGWKSVRVSKDGPRYSGTCRKCAHQFLVYRQA